MFRITARTVLELGAELISSDIIAFYELVKNGFDAKTKNGVEIRFDIVMTKHDYLKLSQRIHNLTNNQETLDSNLLEQIKGDIYASMLHNASEELKQKFRSAIHKAKTVSDLSVVLAEAQASCNTITVTDFGTGMSLEDLNNAFLVIGTASRKLAVDAALQAGATKSPFLGEKGIGRLSAMRLGERLRVETARADDKTLNLLEINWRDFGAVDAMLDEVPVAPITGGPKPTPEWSGTSIIISDLVENWTSARVRELGEYDFARLTDPIAASTSRPRIAIFWNGDRISIPIMPTRLLNAAHARVKGSYQIHEGKPSLILTVEAIDLGFEHPHEAETVALGPEDLEGIVIGKDGEIEDSALTSVGPFTFEAYWFNRRRLSRVDSTGENKAIRDLQDQWSGILLFRDSFRVFPYGEDEDDWLELDRRALRRSGYTLNKTQFIGRVNISRAANPQLVDQTNREGLRVTPEQKVLLKLLFYSIQERLGGFMQFVERQYKSQKIDLSEAKTQVVALGDRAKLAIKRLRQVAPNSSASTVDELQQILLELSDFAAKARARITEVEKESQQMIDLAGVGLMIEVVAHELARSSENALKALDSLKGTEVPQRLSAHFNTLRAEMKSISKRIRILDPLSISGRQRTESFALDNLIREIFEAHEAQFIRHQVRVKLDLGDHPLHVRAVKGMIVQIIENLISNSIHWMDIRAARDSSYKPEIRITLEKRPPTITFEDNGRGIAVENAEKVFRPFFSLKDSKSRRGLGLFIAKEAAEHHGGTLILSDHLNKETGRLHRFVLELPLKTEL